MEPPAPESSATAPASPESQGPFVHMPHRGRVLRPGALVASWATVFWVGWLFVAGGFAAVWNSSRVTGFSTWWLGPESAPRFALHIVPFIAPITLCVMALLAVRRLPWLGIGGALATAAIALGDISQQHRYAVVEFGLAAAGLLVSVASFAGVLRAAEPGAPASADSPG